LLSCFFDWSDLYRELLVGCKLETLAAEPLSTASVTLKTSTRRKKTATEIAASRWQVEE
jgi:hypothetical protein